ncbi:Microtubule-associated protein RP/EB member 1 [Perkinsus olseni]|uniref:Microtubule-associated protein RP/EB member 1 n=1 Tax=Perkinsus olseni TaxID=32597 RepID=A0A7J6NJP7_PEROL|nr:Microtubule-associated protein RP/EB member 1 [Perkinsus olseni]
MKASSLLPVDGHTWAGPSGEVRLGSSAQRWCFLAVKQIPVAVLDTEDSHYKTLGLPTEFPTPEEVRRAYLRLARECHPDKHRSGEDKAAAERRFKKVAEAYEVLSDKERSTSYRYGLLPAYLPRFQLELHKNRMAKQEEEGESFFHYSTDHVPAVLSSAELVDHIIEPGHRGGADHHVEGKNSEHDAAVELRRSSSVVVKPRRQEDVFFDSKGFGEGLLDWLNTLLQTSLTKVEQCASGAVYCQIIDSAFPGRVPLKKVNWMAKVDYEYVHNYKILQRAFDQCNIAKHIDVDKLCKGKFQDNLEFLQWMKAFYDSAVPTDVALNYDPVARRQGCQLPPWAANAAPPSLINKENHAPRNGGGRPTAGRTAGVRTKPFSGGSAPVGVARQPPPPPQVDLSRFVTVEEYEELK